MMMMMMMTRRTRLLLLLKCCFTSTEIVGLLGAGAQDGHLDFHTAPELCVQLSGVDTDVRGFLDWQAPAVDNRLTLDWEAPAVDNRLTLD